MSKTADKLDLDDVIESAFGKIQDRMARHNVSFQETVEAIGHYMGSDMADQFEVWWSEGE
jgi:hypothetical protein